MSGEALQLLLDGNRRYAANKPALDESPRRRMEVERGQKPIAMVLGCVDSRVPPELVFDQGLGDLFVIRTAGEVLDQAALGSLEFGVAELHIPLLVVLGHHHCGAVKAAIDELAGHGEAEADIRYLVEALEPAVENGKRLGGDLWEQAGRAQIALQVDRLKRSPVLAEAVADGALCVVGAWYDLESGLVEMAAEWKLTMRLPVAEQPPFEDPADVQWSRGRRLAFSALHDSSPPGVPAQVKQQPHTRPRHVEGA